MKVFSRLAILTLLLIPATLFGWGDIGSSRFNPIGINQYAGPAANGPGAYKFGYGDYSDRYGYRPDASGNANLNPTFPTDNLSGYRTYTPPPVYPVTTYGGYRGNTVAEALMPGVFR